MPRQRTIWRITALTALCLGAVAMPASAQPLRTMTQFPQGTDAVVIDVRDMDDCLRGSLPKARCLPASSLFDEAGNPVSFHALRWLLGTIGLTGNEDVAVYPGNTQALSDDAVNDAWAVAGLIHLAGQRTVSVLNIRTPSPTEPGMARSLSREAVFTAPMRDRLLKIGSSTVPLRTQLIDFAQHGTAVPIAFAPYH